MDHVLQQIFNECADGYLELSKQWAECGKASHGKQKEYAHHMARFYIVAANTDALKAATMERARYF